MRWNLWSAKDLNLKCLLYAHTYSLQENVSRIANRAKGNRESKHATRVEKKRRAGNKLHLKLILVILCRISFGGLYVYFMFSWSFVASHNNNFFEYFCFLLSIQRWPAYTATGHTNIHTKQLVSILFHQTKIRLFASQFVCRRLAACVSWFNQEMVYLLLFSWPFIGTVTCLYGILFLSLSISFSISRALSGAQ